MPDAPPLVLTIDGRAAEVGARDFEKAVDRVTNTGQKAEKSVGRMEGAFRRLKAEASSLRGTMASLGVAIGTGAIVTASIRSFANLEKGLIGVAKTANLTNSEMQILQESILDISTRVPESTASLLEIAQAAGQLGVQGVDDIALFTETVAKLGGASNLAGEEAATALARILNVTGEPISAIDNLASAMVALGNTFAATEAEIAQVTTRLAQETQPFDTSAQQITGLAAAMAAFGITAERGGTSVARIFGEISSAITEGGDRIRIVSKITGETVDNLQRRFNEDSFSVFIDFLEGLRDAELTATEFKQTMEALGLTSINTVGVLSTLSNNFDEVSRALEVANNGFEENQALNEEAARAATSFSAQMRIAANSVDAAAAEFGQVLAPAIIQVTTDIREFAVEARKTGELQVVFNQVGNALLTLANNAELVATGFTIIAGAKLGAVFGPWGAAVGALAGAFAALAASTDTAKDALDRFNIIIERGNRLVEDSNKASGERKRALAVETQSLITIAEAELERLQTLYETKKVMEEADSLGSFMGEFEPSSRIKEFQLDVDAARQKLEELRRSASQPVTLEASVTPVIPTEGPSQTARSDVASLVSSISGDTTASREAKRLKEQQEKEELIRLSALTVREQRLREVRAEARQASIDRIEADRALGRAIEESVLTPLDRYRESIAEIDRLQQQGIITSEVAKERSQQLGEEYERVALQTNDLAIAITTVGDTFADSFANAILQGESFRDTLASIGRDLAKLAIRTSISSAFQGIASSIIPGLLGGGVGGAAAVRRGGYLGTAGLQKYGEGGTVFGPGTGTSDSVPIAASKGEFVVNAAATKMFYPLIQSINDAGRKKMASGGLVSLPKYATGGVVGRGNTLYSEGKNINLTTNITVENKANPGSDDENRQLAKTVTEQVNRSVKDFVIQIINDETRTGGSLNRGINAT